MKCRYCYWFIQRFLTALGCYARSRQPGNKDHDKDNGKDEEDLQGRLRRVQDKLRTLKNHQQDLVNGCEAILSDK